MLRFAALLSVLLIAVSTQAADKSHPKSLDPDLKIELFAEHPTIVTPTGLDVDYKGRVFAVESNTHFRPKDYKGHKSDRVLVLEDTNGDGKADKTTVFTDGLTHTMSVKVRPLWLDVRGRQSEVRGQKKKKGEPRGVSPRVSSRKNTLSVYIATRRDIYLYHDTNGDLKADKRESIIKLDTKGNYPHNGLAGIAFDAMGWMYFGFGENLGADYTVIGSDGKKLTGGGEGGNLYRCRPDGSKLTKWATGFWNPHASCVDAFGRVFTVDNDPDSRPPCRLLHIIEGGDYGFRFRNGRKGLHPFTAWNGEIPGTLPMVAGTGEAPSGIVAYESDGFPKKYIGNLLVGSWGDHRIDRFVLKPKGASFESRAEPFIQGGEDFRPVGLAVAPDGSLFCTDWVKRDYKLHGHGRVWRISRKSIPTTSRKRKRAAVIDLSTITAKRPVKELENLLSHSRMDVRRMAARALDLSKIGRAKLVSVIANLKFTERGRMDAVWRVLRREDRKAVLNALLDSDDKKVFGDNAGAIFAASWGYSPPGDESMWKGVDSTLNYHKSALIPLFESRLCKILSLLSSKPGLKSIEKFPASLSHFFKSNDPFLVSTGVGAAACMSNRGFAHWIHPDRVNDEKLRLVLVLAARRRLTSLTQVARQALKDPSPDVRRAAVQWAAEENLKQLKPQVEAVLNGKVMNADLFLATLAALEMLDGKSPKDFDKTPAGKYVLPLVKDAKRSPAVRAQALRLVDPDDKRLDEKLFRELLGAKDANLKLEAVRTLAMSDRDVAQKLLAQVALDKAAQFQVRAEALAGLTLRTEEGRRALLNHKFKLDSPLYFEALRSLPISPTTKLQKGLTNVKKSVTRVQIQFEFGKDKKLFPPSKNLLALAERLDLMEQLPVGKRLVKTRPESLAEWYAAAKPQAAKGDAKSGRRAFFHRNSAGCYKCHTVNGRGGKIGPDLSYIARTASRRKLAESILEPSKEIAPQYTLWSFVMDSGKVHHGMILGDTRNGKRQQIGTPEGKIVELPLTQIELRKPQKKSPMPDKLIDQLTATEFRDLLAFLDTLK